jgi:hypothetical protein
VNYNKGLFREKFPEPEKKININKCTREELLDASLFPEIITERIIKYRDIMGPVNRDALVKIGIASNELKEIEGNLTGFIDETEESRTKPGGKKIITNNKQYNKFLDLDDRKILFQKLLENGIGASESLMITELAKNKQKQELINSVQKLEDIPQEKKKTIIKICAGI